MGLFKIIGLCLGLGLWLSWPGLTQAAPSPSTVSHPLVAQSIQITQPLSNHANPAKDWGDRCLSSVQLERYDEAIATCSKAIQLDATTPEHQLNRGISFYRTGNFAAALADATKVLTHAPDDFRGYYNRGLVQVALHNFEAAIDDFDQAASLTAEPNLLVDIYDDRGLAKLMAAQPQAALHDFDQALALNNQDVRAWFNHGCACHQMGRLDDALADLNQVLALDPNHARTYLKRGVLRRAQGDKAGGVADLQQAANCAEAQGQPYLQHYILTLLNEWQTPITTTG